MSLQPITENTMFYGDNLDILRRYLADNSVNLICLDPRHRVSHYRLTPPNNPSRL
jgi:hypothetical protein